MAEDEVLIRLRTEGDTRPLRAATAELNQYGATAARAAEATRKLNQSFQQANDVKKLGDALGLTADQATAAAKRIQELNTAGASSAQKFRELKASLGLTREQFDGLDDAVSQYETSLARSEVFLIDLADAQTQFAGAIGRSYREAEEFADSLGLTARQAADASARIQSLNGVNATVEDKFLVLNRTLGITRDQFDQLDDAVARVGRQSSTLSNFGQGFVQGLGQAAFNTVSNTLTQLPGQILDVNVEFEKFRTVLTTVLRSTEKADQAFAGLQEFAATTPFQLSEVVDAYIKLKQRGLDPTNETLTRLGDIASSQGKSLEEITGAILAATTGEFERLKSFGIQASKSGDQVRLSFQGVNQTVAFTPQAIEQAILSFGQLEGVEGGMAAISQTLGGQLSNLADTGDKVSVAFGQKLLPVLTEAVSSFNEAGPQLEAIASTLGGAFATSIQISGAALGVVVNNSTVAVPLITALALAYNASAIAAQASALQQRLLALQQTAVALATGKATAAQRAQIATMVQGAARAGAFAAAVGAIALVVDTFQEVTEEARRTTEGIQEIETALAQVDEARAASAQLAGETSDAATSAAERNVAIIQDNLNGIQKFLDGIRGGLESFLNSPVGRFFAEGAFIQEFGRKPTDEELRAFTDIRTAAEEAVAQSEVAFGQLLNKTDEVLNQINSADLGAATADQLKAYNDAIAASISNLEKSRPTTDADIEAKNRQIEALRRAQEQLQQYSAATDSAAGATRGATQATEAQLKAQADALEAQREEAFDQQEQAREDAQILADRAAEDENRRLEDEFRRQQEAAQASFEQSQQQAQKAFADSERSRDQAYQQAKQAREKEFNDAQRAAEEAFQQDLQSRQRAAQEQFQAGQQNVDRRVQLATADPRERRDLQRQFREQDREARIRDRFEREQFGGLNAEERQRQIEEQFRAEQEEFEAGQQAERQAFEEEQRQLELAFQQQKEQAQAAFEESQRQAQAIFEESQRQAQAVFEDQQRQRDRAAEDAARQRDRAFEAEKRAYEAETARQVKSILESTRIPAPTPTPIEGRRTGGPVDAGTPYLVHKDEIIVPAQSGYVLNARQAREIALATMRPASIPIASNRMTTSDDRLLKEVIALRQQLTQMPRGEMHQTNYFDAAEVEYERWWQWQYKVARIQLDAYAR